MSLINYLTQIQFEAGAIKLVQGEADKLGIKRPLIVTDKGVRGAGLLDRLIARLKDGAKLPVFDDTPGNPTEAAVQSAVALFKSEKCDGLIALGGGSSIDLAKGVSVLATHDGELDSFMVIKGGVAKITPKVAPLIAIPTTAGAGYRVYLTRRGKQIVLLPCGGDKRSQKRDIEKAIELAESTEIEQ